MIRKKDRRIQSSPCGTGIKGQVMRKPNTFLIGTALLFLLAGCASPNVTLVHPRTGDVRQCVVHRTVDNCVTQFKALGLVYPRTGEIRQCASTGTGIYGTGAAHKMANNCVGQLKALGYKRADELTPAERDQLRPTRGPNFKNEGEIRRR